MVGCPGCGRLHEANEITECTCGWRGWARSMPPDAPLVINWVRIPDRRRRQLGRRARIGVLLGAAAAMLGALIYLATRLR